MASRAEWVAFTISCVRMCTNGAVGRVAGETYHEVKFVVVGLTRICRDNVREEQYTYLSIYSYLLVRRGLLWFEGLWRIMLSFLGFRC